MTKRKKTAILISAIAVIAVLVVGMTLAYFTDQDQKQNVFTLGKVAGSLDETSTDGTKTDNGYNYDHVKPGDKLDKEPFVTVDGDSEDAYIRVSITVGNTDGKLTDTNKQEILDGLDIQDGWVKGTDGYYYYQTKMSKGQQTGKVFTTVSIPPESWGNDQAEAVFTIDLKADLIQADNFTPTTNDGGQIVSWGNVDIQNAK